MSGEGPVCGRASGAASDAGAADLESVEHHFSRDAVMARASGENFPVALRLLPGRTRRHLWAVYGYARLVDNLGDEYPGDRPAALDWVEAQLDMLFANPSAAGFPPGSASRHPVFERLAPTVRRFGLSRAPFDQLLAANRLDQVKTRYADWDELLGYCRLSADPVGRLVLAIFQADTPERLPASDAVCSGLQILEHLQDVGEDARAGRVYLPSEDMRSFGVSDEDLQSPTAGPALRSLIAHEAGRARAMLRSGRRLTASLRGCSRLAVAGFTAGGMAGLDAIEAADFDVLGGRCRAGRARLLRRMADVLIGAAVGEGLAPRRRSGRGDAR